MPMYGGLKEKKKDRKGGGSPLHSEIIVREKVVGLKYLPLLPFLLLKEKKDKQEGGGGCPSSF